MRLNRIVVIASVLALAACGGSAGSIEGLVTAQVGGAAIEGATVVTVPATESVTTAADGTYAIGDVADGSYTVKVTAAGYVAAEKTVDVSGAAATVDFALESATTTGDAVVTVMDTCSDAPLAGATVLVGDTTVTTDAEGLATVTGLDAGEVTFTATGHGFLPAEGTVTVAVGEQATATVDLDCQSGAVAGMARDFLAKAAAKEISVVGSAQALFDNLNDGDTANDPIVVSVRAASHYEIGHVPGAINIPWKSVASTDAISMLGEPGTDQLYEDYCYTGHTGGIANAVMNLLGYKTTNLKFGIMSWTQDADVRVIPPFSADTDAHDFTIETDANDAPATNEPPVLAFDEATDAWEAARLAADAYLNREGMKATIAAQDLFDLLNDGDASNDPFIISVRAPDAYAAGHIPGAINIPWTQIAEPENLAKIPTDRKIVIYCYTGHTGAVATGILGTLGYDVSNLKFGIGSWTTDANVRVAGVFDDAVDSHDFATNAGTNP